VYGDPLQHPQTEEYWGNVNCIGERSCYDEGGRSCGWEVCVLRVMASQRVVGRWHGVGCLRGCNGEGLGGGAEGYVLGKRSELWVLVWVLAEAKDSGERVREWERHRTNCWTRSFDAL
jgi:hypothetical protein